MRVKKAVIPAAGLGTRFLPATKAMAKEMLPIVDIEFWNRRYFDRDRKSKTSD